MRQIGHITKEDIVTTAQGINTMIKRSDKHLIDIPTPNGHASTLALVGDDILLAWFGGTKEGESDVDIYAARRVNGQWLAPWRIAQEQGLQHWNPVFYVEGTRVELYYKVGTPIPSWYTRHMRSFDGGNTWTQPAELVPGDIGGRGPVRNKPILLRSGLLLAPASIEKEETWDAFVDISSDGGVTFTRSDTVPLWRKGHPKPSDTIHEPFEVTGKGVIQPTLWQSDDGHVHMLLRSTEGVILRSDSTDEGKTWCSAYSTGLANNNSGIDLIKLDDGRIALVMNPVSGNWSARTPLTLCISCDGGDSFTDLINLEVNPGEYSYPAILARGNTLYISYTWNRLKIAFWEIQLEPMDGHNTF